MRRRVILAFIVGLAAAGPVEAHNEWGTFNPEFNDETAPLLNEIQNLSNSTSNEDKRYFYSRILLWKPGQTLKGCFIGGTQAQRRSVFNSAANLLKDAKINIAVDFQSTDPFPDCKKTRKAFTPRRSGSPWGRMRPAAAPGSGATA